MELSIIQSVLARVRAAAGPQSLVDLYGSAVYAPDDAADIDVLVSYKNPVALAAKLGFELIPPPHRGCMASSRASPSTSPS